MAERKHESLFPTYFISGFECSTFHWQGKGRRDLADETKHYEYADEDYGMLAKYGFGVAREGIPWPLVDHGDHYDFKPIQPFLDAQAKHKVLPIWDLCHYGYPERLDPFKPEFVHAFVAYCRAVAEYVIPKSPGPHFFTPINEMTFFGFMAGEWGWAAPYGKTRQDRYRMRLALANASIQGIKEIRKIHPEARMVNIDPLINVVPPPDRPDLADEAKREMIEDAYFCWDVLYGREHPELGGSPEILDIVGANCYSFGQMEYREQGPHQSLEPGDPRIVSTCDLIMGVWERYHRPMIIAETSGLEGGREEWLRDLMGETFAAIRNGVDFHAICLFPFVDMPNWHTGAWLHNGFCDLVGPHLVRMPYEPYVQELRRWQHRLNRVTELDDDPLSDPVNLDEVVQAAHQMTEEKSDSDWH